MAELFAGDTGEPNALWPRRARDHLVLAHALTRTVR
jgi:hypothetical protein